MSRSSRLLTQKHEADEMAIVSELCVSCDGLLTHPGVVLPEQTQDYFGKSCRHLESPDLLCGDPIGISL